MRGRDEEAGGAERERGAGRGEARDDRADGVGAGGGDAGDASEADGAGSGVAARADREATTPIKPTTKPAALRRVICSPGTKACASGSTRSGTTAMLMPAKPELTCSWPQPSSAKGSALEKIAHAEAVRARSGGPVRSPAAAGPGRWRARCAARIGGGDGDARGGDRQRTEAGQRLGDRRGTSRPRSARGGRAGARRAATVRAGSGARAARRDMRLSLPGIARREPEPSNDPPWQVGGNRTIRAPGASPDQGRAGRAQEPRPDHGAGR